MSERNCWQNNFRIILNELGNESGKGGKRDEEEGIACGAGHPCDDGAERVRDERRGRSVLCQVSLGRQL